MGSLHSSFQSGVMTSVTNRSVTHTPKTRPGKSLRISEKSTNKIVNILSIVRWTSQLDYTILLYSQSKESWYLAWHKLMADQLFHQPFTDLNLPGHVYVTIVMELKQSI